MAEREGFEPSRRLPAYTRSRRAPSTTRPPLLNCLNGMAFVPYESVALYSWKIPVQANKSRIHCFSG